MSDQTGEKDEREGPQTPGAREMLDAFCEWCSRTENPKYRAKREYREGKITFQEYLKEKRRRKREEVMKQLVREGRFFSDENELEEEIDLRLLVSQSCRF